MPRQLYGLGSLVKKITKPMIMIRARAPPPAIRPIFRSVQKPTSSTAAAAVFEVLLVELLATSLGFMRFVHFPFKQAKPATHSFLITTLVES